MSFTTRAKPSAEFEKAILDRLQGIGWQAFPFGQAQLPAAGRDRLARFRDPCLRPSLIRWMPDIIAFGDRPDGTAAVVLIDAKVCGDRPNYAIEMAAIEAAELYADRLRGRHGPEPMQGCGSGTPYVLVGKRHSVPFAQVFPPIAARTTVTAAPLAVVEW
jgi:hypothetical protein